MTPDIYETTRAREAAHAFYEWVLESDQLGKEGTADNAWLTPGANTPVGQIVWDVIVEFNDGYIRWAFVPEPDNGLTIKVWNGEQSDGPVNPVFDREPYATGIQLPELNVDDDVQMALELWVSGAIDPGPVR